MKHLSALNSFFWRYRWRFVLGAVFVILTNYFRILSPQLTGYVVDTVVQALKPGNPEIHPDVYAGYDILVRKTIHYFSELSFQDKILFAGVLLLLLAVLSGIFMFLMRQTIIVMSRLIEYDQKNEIFNHYQKLDAGFYKANHTGDLMNRISEDVSRVRMYTGPAIMYFINLAAVIGFSIFFMYRSDPRLTFYALVPFPFLAIAIYYVNTIIHRKSEKIQSLLSNLTTNAQESYSGIRVIKSFVQEKSMLSFFTNNSEEYKNNALSLAKTESVYFPSIGVLVGVSTLLTIMAGSMDVVNGVPGASVGKVAEFVLYIQMLTFPVSAIGWTASMTQRAAASQKRINEFLNTTPAIQDAQDAKHIIPQGDILLKEVQFTYPNTGIHAIKDLNIHIRPGNKIAIVGRTGSGKSTLAQLLLRIYEPDSGSIELDGIPIDKIHRKALRKSISYVPQDIFLFSDTIRNNIAFAEQDVHQEDIIRAAKAAGVHEEIMRFPAGYDTSVGERGITLSGGQKQRISIARALVKNPSILILDDCLSAVDAETEQKITGALESFLQNKTAIIITHRLFSLMEFDTIIVMHEGRIAETGSHSELLNARGLYAEMYHRQQLTGISG
ncbi:MAG: ABC transporter ATP-binding protein [Ferruginibacter sp.]|nr:ABC transporter ATP-binding protein [Ferruginibacter sp.]